MDTDDAEFPAGLLDGYCHELDAAFSFVSGQSHLARNSLLRAAASYKSVFSSQEADPEHPFVSACLQRYRIAAGLITNGTSSESYASELLLPGSAAAFFTGLLNRVSEYVPFYARPVP